jgi:hypothetical protein
MLSRRARSVLTGALTGNETISLNGAITVGTLTIGSTGSSGTFTVVANGGSLTFQTTSGSAALNDQSKGGDSINAPINLASDLTLASAGTAPLAIGGTITGSGTVTTSGTVALTTGTTVGAGVTLAGTGTIAPTPVLFATSYYDNALYEFNANTGALLATLIPPNSATALSLPSGLTVGPDGNLYISCQNSQSSAPFNDSIVEYNLTTQSLTTFIDSTILDTLAALPENGSNTVFDPAGLQFGLDGNLYVTLNGGVASSSGAVVRFGITDVGGTRSYNGIATTVATASAGLVQPSGLTFGTSSGDTNNLYISNAAAGDVVKITGATGGSPSTSVFVAAGSGNPASPLQFPAGLVWQNGTLYVVDLGALTGAGQILTFDSSGNYLSTFVAAGTGSNPGDLADQFPSDAVFNSQGDLLSANLGPDGPTTGSPNTFAGSIYEYSSTGSFISFSTPTGGLVDSSQFPSTGPTASYSGIIPSQLVYGAAAGVDVDGTLNPGGPSTPGILTAGDVTFAGGSQFAVTLNGTTAGSGYSQLVSTGTVDLSSATLSPTLGFTPSLGATFDIITAQAVTGTFNSLLNGNVFTAGGLQFQINYTATNVILTRVQSPAITSANATTFYTGINNSFQVTATGSPTITFTESGTLPNGITFSPSGLLSGMPTQTGDFAIVITATNGIGTNAMQSFTLTVDTGVAPSITSVDHAEFVTGTGGSFTVTADGTPTPTLAETATLPSGVMFDASTGDLTVGSSTASGIYSLTFTATNGVGTAASQSFTLTVGTAPVITSADSTTFATGMSNSFQVTATGFPVPTFSFTGTLPTGVTLTTAGLLSGTPTQTGPFTFDIIATNAIGSMSQTFTLTVNAGVAPTITSNDQAVFTAGTGGTFTVTATGTPTPMLAETATLPSGVSFTPATGTLTVGTTTAVGTYNLVFTASNGVGSDASQNFTLTVGAAPLITSGDSDTFTTGANGGFQVVASGFPSPTFSETGTLPNGVGLSTSGLLSGMPTQSGIFSFMITATNVIGSNNQNFTLTVDDAPQITSSNSTTFTAGTNGSFQATATGFPNPTFSETGTLPSGVSLSPSGLLSGIATEGGTFPIVITATNGVGTDATQSFTLTVNAAPAITSADSDTFQTGTNNSFQVVATGFPAPTFSFTGTLPTGVTLSTAGLLSGMPTQGGSFPIDMCPGSRTEPYLVYTAGANGQYSGSPTATLQPFGAITADVRSAVGDVNGDGIPDYIFATGPGTPFEVTVISGAPGNPVLVAPFDPFLPAPPLAQSDLFTAGGFVSAGDFLGNGRDQIVVSPDQSGGPRISIYDMNGAAAATAQPYTASGSIRRR